MIREGDDWKIRMLTTNLTPAPSPTASPSNQLYPDPRGGRLEAYLTESGGNNEDALTTCPCIGRLKFILSTLIIPDYQLEIANWPK